jgi:hypothetical protein
VADWPGGKPNGPGNARRGSMEIPKDKLIDFLKKEGQSEKAQRLEAELPEKVDHELHSDVLEKHGVNPQELISKIKF